MAILKQESSKTGGSIKAIFIMPFGLLLLAQCVHFSVFGLLLSFLSISGIFVCSLIILHTMNKDSPLASKLCAVNGKFNCDKVLGSGLGKISKHINLGDVGLVYFIGQSLFIFFEAVNGRLANCMVIMLFPCLFAIAFSFVSLLYQGFLIKAWCKMCLLVVGVVWLQGLVFAISFAIKANSLSSISWGSVFSSKGIPSLIMFFASIFIASIWFFVKSAISTASEAKLAKAKLLLFKRNINVFKTLLRTQRTVNTDLWPNEYFLGNRNAAVQLTMALNPYCPPCAREYKNMVEVLEMFPEQLGVAIRFLVNTDIENKPTKAVKYLLQEYTSTTKIKRPSILEDWFKSLSLDGWKKNDSDADETTLLKKHQQWFEESKIVHTPTLFINGREFPKLYDVSDLKMLVQRLSIAPIKKNIADTVS